MFQSLTAVILLIVFLIPGYIWRYIEGHLVQHEKKSAWEVYALELLARSTILYLPTLNLFLLKWESGWTQIHPWRAGIVAILQVVVAPAAAGVLSGIVRQKNWIPLLLGRLGLKAFKPIPSVWASHFQKIDECWVIVTLKSGQRAYGFFGEGSEASSDPEIKDIFISHAVVLGENGFRLVENSGGIYIAGTEIQTLEFIEKTP